MSLDARLPLACVPEAIPSADRSAHFALIERLLQGVREKVPLDDGYAFRFDASAFADVARFAENERLCCPFLAFTLEAQPAGGPLWLRVTGPEGTGEFLEKELPLWQARGAQPVRRGGPQGASARPASRAPAPTSAGE
ncbi:MAG TPA: hypothetical protein VIL18_15195 [Longimicrobiales bacterium]